MTKGIINVGKLYDNADTVAMSQGPHPFQYHMPRTREIEINPAAFMQVVLSCTSGNFLPAGTF